MVNDGEGTFRSIRLAGFVVLALLGAVIATGNPSAGLRGKGLGITLGLAGYGVSFAVGFALRRRETAATPRAVMLGVLVISTGVLLGFQPNGAAIAGLYAAAGAAGVRARGRAGFVLLALIVAAGAVALGLGGHGAVDVIADEVGLVMVFLVTRLAREARDGRERAERLLAELEDSRDAFVQAAAVGERGRIARELHDVLAHSLSALAVQLEGTRLLARTRGADDEVVAAIERAHHLAGSGLEEARRAIGALRGDDLPGPDLLGALVLSFEEQAGITCAFEVGGTVRTLPSDARLALYRTAQEALTNVRKHADPERVELRLRYAPDGTSLVVEDHAAARVGAGARGLDTDLGEAGGGYGLSGMRERAELLDGRLTAAPTADGFRVELWLPA